MYGIVYATKSKIIRRVITPDNPADLTNGTHLVGPGETMLVVQGGQRHGHHDWMEQVRIATGVSPPDAGCAVVDHRTGAVIDHVMADPDLDEHPLGKLIRKSK